MSRTILKIVLLYAHAYVGVGPRFLDPDPGPYAHVYNETVNMRTPDGKQIQRYEK